MQVRIIDTNNQQDVEKFVKLPFQLYAGSKQWVPPLLSSARKILNRDKHPFYDHSEAAFLLAEQDGKVLGRLAVMDNVNYQAYRNVKAGFFGFFEAVEDQAVADGLFAAGFEWARERGLDSMMGPRGMNPTEASGMLVEGFEHRAAMTIPYNLPYYDALVKSVGFEKDTDHLSGYLPGDYQLPERVLRIAERIKERRGYWVKSFKSKEEIWEWVPRVFEVYETSFVDSHTFFPATERERKMIAEPIVEVTDPGLVKMVMKGDDMVGFIISYYDLSAALQRCNGRMWPLGWYWLMTERRRTKWAIVNGAGLLPEYQGTGANVLLYTELARTIKEYGFEYADLAQVNEVNRKSMGDMETVGVNWYKRHRAYKIKL
jgi:GNAT superfamily N-acetyltransferase